MIHMSRSSCSLVIARSFRVLRPSHGGLRERISPIIFLMALSSSPVRRLSNLLVRSSPSLRSLRALALSLAGGYTPEEAAALFDALDALDANARLVYAATGLTIDVAFPPAYGLLFAVVLVRLFRAPLFVLPLALAGADVLENPTVAARALGHAAPPSPLAWLAGGFTLVKTLLIVATLAATGAGAARWLRVRMRR